MDRRHEILRAAAEELLSAGAEDIFAFLTPARLALGESRAWSPGIVRYHFSRNGLGFDREMLIAEVAREALGRLEPRLDRWVAGAEEALGRSHDPREALAAVLAGVSEHVDADDLRLLRLAGLAGSDDARLRHDLLARAAKRVLDAFAHRAGAAPAEDTVDELARAVATRIAAGDASAGALADIAATVLTPPGPSAASSLRPSDEDAVLRLERRLSNVDPRSPDALRIIEQLVLLGPTGDWSFARVRSRLSRILALPDIRETESGRRVWIAAAEVVAMASADRELAEEAATFALAVQPLAAEATALTAALRTGWLLIRLDRLEEARAQFERVARLAARDDLDELRALADAFAALAASLAGPLDACFTGSRDGRGTPSGVRALADGIAAAAAGRALLLNGQHDVAAEVLCDRAHDEAPLSLGTNMVHLYRGWLQLARGEDHEALATLTRLRARLARIGAQNPAGWHWLEPSVAALVRLGRRAQATELIASARASAVRWGTPLVLAELERARALTAETHGERRDALRNARTLLAPAGPSIEYERAEMAAALVGGGAPPGRAGGIATRSILVQVHLPLGGPLDAMSPRVAEVALQAAQGGSNEEIAARLGIAPSTVGRHVSAALRATGTRNRTELAALLAHATPGRDL